MSQTRRRGNKRTKHVKTRTMYKTRVVDKKLTTSARSKFCIFFIGGLAQILIFLLLLQLLLTWRNPRKMLISFMDVAMDDVNIPDGRDWTAQMNDSRKSTLTIWRSCCLYYRLSVDQVVLLVCSQTCCRASSEAEHWMRFSQIQRSQLDLDYLWKHTIAFQRRSKNLAHVRIIFDLNWLDWSLQIFGKLLVSTCC